MQKVAYVHLYNDYSGSPAVLANAIRGGLEHSYESLIISSRSEGKLSHIPGADYSYINYAFHPNKLVRLWRFLWAQIQLFIKVLWLPADYLIYVNTVLPAGAACAAYFSGKRLIYHLHESSVKPAVLKKLLFKTAERTASKAIYVSQFLRDSEALESVTSTVIYNALKPELESALSELSMAEEHIRNILMVCSLKDYKGIPEFISLSNVMPDCKFTLVVNANEEEIGEYMNGKKRPDNLYIFPSQKDLIPFYNASSMVLNLSRKEEWLETFGLTILEGMAAGRPVLGQTAGGTAELINHGQYGYCIDGCETEVLKELIEKLHTDRSLYLKMSELARTRATHFNIRNQQKAILSFISDIEGKNELEIDSEMAYTLNPKNQT